MTLQLESASAYFCFKPYWQNGVQFARRYHTNVMTSMTGADEQRSALLTATQRSQSYTVRTTDYGQQSYLRRYLKDYRHKVWGVPLWGYEMALTATETPGATVLDVDGTADRELVNSGEVVLVANHSTYEVATIQSFASNSITITAPGLSGEWASGKKLYPVLACELRGTDFGLLPQTPEHIQAHFKFVQSMRCEDV